jgi:hypothetical protein
MEKRIYKTSFDLELLFGLPEQPVSEQIFNYKSSEIEIPVQTDAFTIVLSRDVRRNTFMAAEMAFNAARGDLSKDVWYVNTYAGVNFLKDCFRRLFDSAGIAPPPPRTEEIVPAVVETSEEPSTPGYVEDTEPAYDSPKPHPISFVLAPGEPEPPEYTKKLLQDGTLYTFMRGRYQRVDTIEAWNAERALVREQASRKPGEGRNVAQHSFQGKTLDPSSVLPNLRVFHVPIGHWSTLRLSKDIRTYARIGCRQVIIINSFEYAPLTRGRKERMARELVQLCDKLQLSIVIFSHEMKKDVEPGLPGRGPIGILAAKAGAVSRFPDPFEKFYGTRDTSKNAGNATVNEKQMRLPESDQENSSSVSISKHFL